MAGGKKTRGQRRSSVVRFHRWVGLLSFIVLFVIVATGVVLNHATGLNLDGRVAGKGWLMRWYGMEPEGDPLSYLVGERRVSGWDRSLFFDETLLDIGGELVGAVAWGDEIAVVCREDVYLLNEGGELLEKVLSVMLPDESIEKAGLSEKGDLALRAGGRSSLYHDRSFEELDGEGRKIKWVEGVEIDDEKRRVLTRAHRGGGLPLSRVILDLHSGKFFGAGGVVIYDLAAVAVILLSATGLWLAVRNFYRSGRGGRSQG